MNYDRNSIDLLLEKYWEGDTSLAQESELRTYFNSGQVSTEHELYISLFQYFSTQRDMTTDLDVESVLSKIAKEDKRSSTGIFRLISRKYSMGIAAALTLMLSVVTVMNIQSDTSSANIIVLDEATETEEALRVTTEALALLGSKIDMSSKRVKSSVAHMSSASLIR